MPSPGLLSADELFVIATMALHSQDVATAEECLRESAVRARQSGKWGRELQALHRLAELLAEVQRLPEAIPMLRAALVLYAEKVERPDNQGTRTAGGPRHWLRLGHWCVESGDSSGALEAAEEHLRRIRRDYGTCSLDTAYGLDEGADLVDGVDPARAAAYRADARQIRLRIADHQHLLASARVSEDRSKALALAAQYEEQALTLYHLPSAAELEWVAAFYEEMGEMDLAVRAWDRARAAHGEVRDWVPPALGR